DELVAGRARVGEAAEGGADAQVSLPVEREPLRAAVGEPDVVDAGSRAEEELVLQLPVLARKDHVHARPEVAVDDSLVGAQTCMPLGRVVPEQIVDPGRPRALAADGDVPVRAEEAKRKRHTAPFSLLPRTLEGEHRLPAREEDREAGALGGVADGRVGLAGIGGEGEWQLPVVGERLLLRRRRRRPPRLLGRSLRRTDLEQNARGGYG